MYKKQMDNNQTISFRKTVLVWSAMAFPTDLYSPVVLFDKCQKHIKEMGWDIVLTIEEVKEILEIALQCACVNSVTDKEGNSEYQIQMIFTDGQEESLKISYEAQKIKV